MSEIFAPFPFRLKMDDRNRIVPAYPEECEPECQRVRTVDYEGWDRKEERQCRGCGRWGIFSPRAITANLPNGTITLGPGKAFVLSANGQWQQFAEVLPSVQRPNDGCPCCTGRPMESARCWCRTNCGSNLCQAGE